jgi:hypothetical protein
MVRIINWTLWLEAIDAATARHLSPGAAAWILEPGMSRADPR